MLFRSSAVFIPCLLFLLVTAFRPQAQTLPAPGANFSQITSNGIWTWYGEPKAVYYEGVHKRTYMGWLSNTGTVAVGYYDTRRATRSRISSAPTTQPTTMRTRVLS